MSYHLKIYHSDKDFPECWSSTVGNHNVMLSQEYFCALHASLPSNMECFMVGFLIKTNWWEALCFNTSILLDLESL